MQMTREAGAGHSQRPVRTPDTSAPLQQIEAFLTRPMVYPHTCKLVYADTWRQSLVQSHPSGPELDNALAELDAEVAALQARIGHLVQAAGWQDAVHRTAAMRL